MASDFQFKLPGVGGGEKHHLSDFFFLFFLEQVNQDGHSNRQGSELLMDDGDDVIPRLTNRDLLVHPRLIPVLQ